ncbi:MAG: SAM-dependent methyltransferase [uncultured Corynebacteriales bacterium]|uniref:SAM-dependent methyltransferase n=1 Tax=uncultured Mycobacteriales bacterium TaxID=581187 RepID=A0A6J4J9I8_9ACTN|nr:MAG: SAM-dependent methyltransferase [uncultured Corynebacteriales bacterium]
MEPTGDLLTALDAVLGDTSGAELQRLAARLTAAYRGDALPGEVLDSPAAARAYAAYRMPATSAAVRAALQATFGPAPGAEGDGGWRAPRTLLDVGGGTGGALWAAAAVLPGLTAATVLDRSQDALALGRELAARGPAGPVRDATFTPGRIGAELPAADLVTMAYVLAELPPDARRGLVGAVRADTVVVVEPGTPAGHRRVLEARAVLVGRGFRVVAPCPHDLGCPLDVPGDWCHFAARLPRSSRHRQAKGGTLGWEDEKFSYVAATRGPAGPGPGRIVRHPYLRKGLVELTVCDRPPGISRRTVSKRQGTTYRAARDAGWGDPWPPED